AVQARAFFRGKHCPAPGRRREEETRQPGNDHRVHQPSATIARRIFLCLDSARKGRMSNAARVFTVNCGRNFERYEAEGPSRFDQRWMSKIARWRSACLTQFKKFLLVGPTPKFVTELIAATTIIDQIFKNCV